MSSQEAYLHQRKDKTPTQHHLELCSFGVLGGIFVTGPAEGLSLPTFGNGVRWDAARSALYPRRYRPVASSRRIIISLRWRWHRVMRLVELYWEIIMMYLLNNNIWSPNA